MRRLLFCICVVCLNLAANPSACADDVVVEVVDFGRCPLGVNDYASNIWALTAYQGRLYLGYGDSQKNAGPLAVWAMNPEAPEGDRFFRVPVQGSEHDGLVDEEQIARFVTMDGRLVIPGHDATAPDNWSLGNFYTFDSKTTAFTKHRVIPGGIHVYDLEEHRGLWFAAIGTGSKNPLPGPKLGELLLVSEDKGATWRGAGQSTILDNSLYEHRIGYPVRAYEIFTLRGEVYASAPQSGFIDNAEVKLNDAYEGSTLNNSTYFNRAGGSAGIYRYDWTAGRFFPLELSADQIFPDVPSEKLELPANATLSGKGVTLHFSKGVRMGRNVEWGGELFYLGVETVDDHQMKPFGLYRSGPELNASRIVLPKSKDAASITPWDIALFEDPAEGISMVVCASETLERGGFRNGVFRMRSDKTIERWFTFEYPAFTRSMAWLDGHWYFGTGGDKGSADQWTGHVLRYKTDGS